MYLSMVVFSCMFILGCAGFFEEICGAFKIHRGIPAAVSMLCLLLSPLQVFLGKWFMVNPAFLVLLALGLAACGFHGDMVTGLAAAFLSAISAWLIHCLFPAFTETGLMCGSVAALAGMLFKRRGSGLLCALATPVFFGFLTMLEDWYLFDITLFSLGSPAQLDGQAWGGFLFCLLMSLPRPAEKSVVIQKNKA